MQGEGKEYSKGFTIVLHVGCLVNLLGMGFTFKYSDVLLPNKDKPIVALLPP